MLLGSDLVFVGRCRAGGPSLGAESPRPPRGLALSTVSTSVPSPTPPLCPRRGQRVSISHPTLPWTRAHRNVLGAGRGWRRWERPPGTLLQTEVGGDGLICAVPSHFSRVRLFATPWTVAHQAPLSMGFSRQEPPPGDLPDPGSPRVSQVSCAAAGSLALEPSGSFPFCLFVSKRGSQVSCLLLFSVIRIGGNFQSFT